MKVELIIPEKVDGMNGKNGLIRGNKFSRKSKKTTYSWLFLAQTPVKFKGEVNIKITRSYKGTPMDFDNLVSTSKIPLDALVMAGIIEDDSMKIIGQPDYKQFKIGMKENHFFKIVIEQEQ